MAKYKISILGLYQYSDTLFDNLSLPIWHVPSPMPEFYWQPDRDTLISTILEKSADFMCLYPNFDFMKMMIGVWSRNVQYMMYQLWKSSVIKYEVAENYDRTSSISRSGSSSGTGTTTNSNTAFNSDAFKAVNKSDTTASDSTSETITDHTHGNIGIRSAQELIMQQRDVAMFKWYDVVSDDFIHKFCIELY